MKSTKEKIEVMQAFLNGEEIEMRSKSSSEEWLTIRFESKKHDLTWDWGRFDYRVKPSWENAWKEHCKTKCVPEEGWAETYFKAGYEAGAMK